MGNIQSHHFRVVSVHQLHQHGRGQLSEDELTMHGMWIHRLRHSRARVHIRHQGLVKTPARCDCD